MILSNLFYYSTVMKLSNLFYYSAITGPLKTMSRESTMMRYRGY